MKSDGHNALYIFMFVVGVSSRSISEYPRSMAICSPLPAAMPAVGTEIFKALATPVIVRPSSGLCLIGKIPRTKDSFPRHGHRVVQHIHPSLQTDPLNCQSGFPFHRLVGLCRHIRYKIAAAQDGFIASKENIKI